MQDRITALMACGFLSFFVLGAAGAASDTYFETIVLNGVHAVSCNQDLMASEYSTLGTPDCSVHRVSTTYHRQQMANNLYRDQMVED